MTIKLPPKVPSYEAGLLLSVAVWCANAEYYLKRIKKFGGTDTDGFHAASIPACESVVRELVERLPKNNLTPNRAP